MTLCLLPLRGGKKRLYFCWMEKPPSAFRQRAKTDRANADPFESHYFESDQLAHATYLPLAPLAQNDPELLVVEPLGLGGQKWPAIEREPVAK